MPKVGIVISNYNGWQDTLVCLDSLQKQTFTDFEVILIDDASPNDSVAQLQNKLPPNTVFLPQERNVGFAAANNIGMRRALDDGCDFALLLNNDTSVRPDFLEKLLAETPAGAVSCPKMLFMDPPDEIWFAGGELDPKTGKVKHLGGHKKDGPEFAEKKQVSFITFCCVLLPRAVIEKVGYLDETLFMYCEDVDYCIRLAQAGVPMWFLPDAAERLIETAEALKNTATGTEAVKQDVWREEPMVEKRLQYALIKGIGDHLEEDLAEAVKLYPKAVDIIEGPLMEGINKVGELFGAGKMFLPQVVKTARTMKKAVAILQPLIEADKQEGVRSAGKVLMATVKGDVHDIGKNIVSVVMACNNYEIIDLGVMVPAEMIVRKAIEEKVDIIGLSGLITPSLEEMAHVAVELKRAGLDIPIMIGGATTSKLHTALKIAPVYGGPVIHMKDASQNALVAARLLNPESSSEFVERLNKEYEDLRLKNSAKQVKTVSLEEAQKNKLNLWS
jgi:methylmalonyl-CoA mutase cobalamin-binding domain/chain